MLPVAVGLDSIERTHSLWQWVPLDDSPSFLFKNCGWYFHDLAPSNCVREERTANISMPSQLGDAMVWVGLVPIKNHGDTWFPAELYWEMRPSGSDKGIYFPWGHWWVMRTFLLSWNRIRVSEPLITLWLMCSSCTRLLSTLNLYHEDLTKDHADANTLPLDLKTMSQNWAFSI